MQILTRALNLGWALGLFWGPMQSAALAMSLPSGDSSEDPGETKTELDIEGSIVESLAVKLVYDLPL